MIPLFPDTAFAVATIWGEARGETHEGRVAVAEVIRNRMRLRYFSDGTAAGTCLRPLQFSCWNDTDPNRLRMVRLDAADAMVLDCTLAWAEAIGGTLVAGALLYLNPAVVRTMPAWVLRSREVAVIGRHHFYVPA